MITGGGIDSPTLFPVIDFTLYFIGFLLTCSTGLISPERFFLPERLDNPIRRSSDTTLVKFPGLALGLSCLPSFARSSIHL